MLIEQTSHVVETSSGPMTIYLITPKIAEYPNAKWPGVVVWSEIYQVTGPVLRFATSIASQGYIVACPCVYHEFEGAAAMPYDTVGTDNGNSYKIRKELTAYDSDAKVSVDFLMASKSCNGRIASTGMCLGGHLVTNGFIPVQSTNALDPRIISSVCYFPTDIHDHALSATGDDSLVRAGKGEIKGEVVLIFGVQDGHIPKEGRNLIRETLTSPSIQPPLKLSFLELQASHAFIRDEMSKGRFDSAISKVCFELLMEVFGRTIGRDLGERVVEGKKEEKLIC
ncbi:carboxymethylenebutenolidase, partial [Phenoliferia sp. Uapishka_3]